MTFTSFLKRHPEAKNDKIFCQGIRLQNKNMSKEELYEMTYDDWCGEWNEYNRTLENE